MLESLKTYARNNSMCNKMFHSDDISNPAVIIFTRLLSNVYIGWSINLLYVHTRYVFYQFPILSNILKNSSITITIVSYSLFLFLMFLMFLFRLFALYNHINIKDVVILFAVNK